MDFDTAVGRLKTACYQARQKMKMHKTVGAAAAMAIGAGTTYHMSVKPAESKPIKPKQQKSKVGGNSKSASGSSNSHSNSHSNTSNSNSSSNSSSNSGNTATTTQKYTRKRAAPTATPTANGAGKKQKRTGPSSARTVGTPTPTYDVGGTAAPGEGEP